MENNIENDVEIIGDEKQYVIFTLEKEDYGLEITKIKTIENLLPITRVPKTPLYLEGVFNLRGDIIPVIDLRKRFELPEVEKTEDTRIIISTINEITVGFIVDLVEEVIHIRDENLDSNNFTSHEIKRTYIQSIAKYNNKIITILNLDKLISITEEDLA
ncbi:MAG: chemotaxis protein CheW [Clostridiales bacterium]